MKFFFLLLLLFSLKSNAFSLLSAEEPRWQKTEIPVDWDPSACHASYDLEANLDQVLAGYWNAVPFTGLRLKKGQMRALAAGGNSGVIHVSCSSDTNYFTGTILGVALVPTSGDLEGITVLIRQNWAWDQESEMVREMVLAHEIGHAIGFGHTDVPHSVMLNGWQGTGLTNDDMAAMQYLYPRDETKNGAFGCSKGSIQTTTSTQDLSLLILLMAWIGLKLRRFKWKSVVQ